MRGLIVGLILLFFVSLTVPTSMQDSQEGCGADLIAEAADVIKGLSADLLTSDDPMSVLRELIQRTTRFVAMCEELTFTSENEGLQPVIGPVVIPEGVYRVTATTTGFFILHIEPLEGECGEGRYMTPGVFNLSAGTADAGAQAIVNSTGCEALIAIDNVTQPWEVTFEKVR